MAPPPSQLATTERGIAVGKDLLSLLRDAALVVLFILLLVAPSVIGDRLSEAGFEEGSVMGFKWKQKAEKFGNSTRELQQALVETRRQLADQASVIRKNQEVIATLTARLGTSPSAAKAVTQENREALARSAAVSRATGITLQRNQDTVDQARELAGDARWAVVMGGDRTIPEAQYEVEQATRAGIGGASIYLRQGSYRTVAPAKSRSDVDAVLSLARRRHRDAYAVDLTKWCPRIVQREGYLECR